MNHLDAPDIYDGGDDDGLLSDHMAPNDGYDHHVCKYCDDKYYGGGKIWNHDDGKHYRNDVAGQ